MLTDKDQRELEVLLAVAQERGLDLSDLFPSKSDIVFPKGTNGYFTKRDGGLYNPTEQQEKFIKSRAIFSLFRGSRGSGKTASGAQKALRKIEQGQSGAIYNPDFENLKTSTWPEFKQWIPWEMVAPGHRYRYNEEWDAARPFKLSFVNGASVLVKGVKDPDSARGPNINWLWYDEPGRGLDKEGLAWKIAIASVRIGHEPQSWATGTPAGIDHWLYKFFIKQEIPEDALEIFADLAIDRALLEHFYETIDGNKDNLDPAFFASILAAYPEGWLRKQEVFGEFVAQGGVLGNREWFRDKIVPAPPEYVKGRIRYWDLAASEKKIVRGKKINDPDESVGTKMSQEIIGDKYPNFYIEDQTSGFWEYKELRENIFTTALLDGPTVPIVFEEEPGSGGKNQVAALKDWIHNRCDELRIPRFQIEGWRPDNDRVILANIWFAEAAKGKIHLVEGDWNEPFLDQLSGFPISLHDDKITSTSGARINLAPIQTWSKIKFLKLSKI